MSEEKKVYEVRLPFAGVVAVIVEAEDKESAVQNAIQKADEYIQFQTNHIEVEIESWQVYEKLYEGGVFYGELYEAEVAEGSLCEYKIIDMGKEIRHGDKNL